MKKRNSKYELIRILAMLFIILSHFSLYGKWSEDYLLKGMQFQPLGQIGVYFFVMISGYFLSKKQLNLKQAIFRTKKVWVKTLFYSWLILILNIFFNFTRISFKSILDAVFPVIFNEYWFITSFIVLMLLTPILNYVVNISSKKQLMGYLIIFIVIVDILPIIKTGNEPLGGILSTGIMLPPYLIAGYIKKYNIKIRNIFALLLITVGIGAEYISMYILRYNRMGRFTYGIFPLIATVGLFLMIKNSKDFVNPVINYLSTSVLAAYLITENPFLRSYIWEKVFNIHKYQISPYFTLIGIGIVIFILIICCLFDKLLNCLESNICKFCNFKRIKRNI